MFASKSLPKTVDVPTMCPFCGKMFDCTMYPEIHIPGDHKLKKKVLNKTLFFPTCPYCNKELKLKAACMYRNDIKKEWFVVTDRTDREIEKMMKTGNLSFGDFMNDDDVVNFMKGLYVRRVVHDVDAFREKILLSDNNYDDRIIELMKYSLSGLIEKETHTPVYRIFLEESSGNQMKFTAILGSQAPFEYSDIKVSAAVYTHYRNKYLDKLGHPEADEYISTDQKWAAKSGLLKDEDPGIIIPV